jgi:hypothetical protein
VDAVAGHNIDLATQNFCSLIFDIHQPEDGQAFLFIPLIVDEQSTSESARWFPRKVEPNT